MTTVIVGTSCYNMSINTILAFTDKTKHDRSVDTDVYK